MTSSEQNQGGRAQDEILAGEYVLGVLTQEARRQVERRMAGDRAFAKIVKRWKVDIATLQRDESDFAPVLPKRRIVQRREKTERWPPVNLERLWRSAIFWRFFAFGALAVAAAALVPDVDPAQRLPAVETSLGALSVSGSLFDLPATYDPDTGQLKLAPVAADLPADKSMQLWLVTLDGRQQSLGTLGPNSNGELAVPIALRDRLRQDATLTVTLEPSGGSTTGLPTGKVIATGRIRGF
jgi:anti-sigma-K factor RskA